MKIEIVYNIPELFILAIKAPASPLHSKGVLNVVCEPGYSTHSLLLARGFKLLRCAK